MEFISWIIHFYFVLLVLSNELKINLQVKTKLNTSEFDRIFERFFVLYPFRSKSWVESYKRYHNKNCMCIIGYIIFSQIDAKRGLTWRHADDKTAKFCTHELNYMQW